MALIRTSLDPLRTSLLAALGLLVACAPGSGGTDSSSSSTGTASSSGSSGSSGNPTSSTGQGSTTDGTASGGQTTSTSPGTTSDGTTSPTSGGPTSDGTTDSTTGNPIVCEGQLVELMQGFVDPPTPSGFVQCDDGLIHRPEPRECLAPVTPTSCPPDASPASACHTDADCNEKPFGSCQIDMVFGGLQAPTDTCSCVYGCQTDADCGAGEVCRCAGASLGLYTECIPADCITDADCPGQICGFSHDICAPGVHFAHCTTPADSCAGDGDCQSPPCMWDDVSMSWACANAACGRPFFVDGDALTAPPAARDDWTALLAAPLVGARERAALAAYWTRIGLCEHASVASFARFILQLLAVAAPAELVGDAQRALADEVEHARLCFALASLYQGTGVGPGPLPAVDVPVAADRDAILAAVIREACVGETLSALEAREAAARAADPALRRVLEKIAADEQRHAELGWRFVQWALARAGADLRARAGAVFAAAIADAEATIATLAAEPPAPELRPHGVIDAPLRAALWQEGLRALVRPTADLLAA